MRIKITNTAGAILAGLVMLFLSANLAYASDDGNYVTILVEATDENEGLLYAMDTTDEEKFTKNNSFEVENGTTHTIYVKDAAGNLSSKTYTVDDPGMVSQEPDPVPEPSEEPELAKKTENIEYHIPDPEPSTEPDIDLTVDLYGRSSYAGRDKDSYQSTGGRSPAEEGAGTVYESIKAPVSSDADRIFYTITTKDGQVFYLMIDQTNASNNVYLLDQVTLTDLKSIAQDDLKEAETEETRSLLGSLTSSKEDPEEDLLIEDPEPKKKTNAGKYIILLLVLAAAGGAYYYLKVYRTKKDEQMDLSDALDLEDFEVDDNRGIEDKDDADDDVINWEEDDDGDPFDDDPGEETFDPPEEDADDPKEPSEDSTERSTQWNE